MPHFRNIPRRQSRNLMKQEDDVYNLADPSLLPSAFQVPMDAPASSLLQGSTLGASRVGSIGPDRSHHFMPANCRRDQDGTPYYREASVTSEDFSDYSPPISSSHARSAHSRRKPDNHIPRPRNAFIFFRSHFYLQRGLGGGKSTHQNDISRNAGEIWRNLSPEERRPFQLRAEREKLEHQTKFPNYVYTPGGTRGSSRRRKSKSLAHVKRRKGSAPVLRTTVRKAAVVPKAEQYSPAPTAFDEVSALSHTPTSQSSVDITPILTLTQPSPDLPQLEYPNSSGVLEEPVPEFVATAEIPHLELSPLEKKENIDTDFARHPMYERMTAYLGFNPYIYTGVDSYLPPLPQYGPVDIDQLTRGPVSAEGLLSAPLGLNMEVPMLPPTFMEETPVFRDPWRGEEISTYSAADFDQFFNFEAFENSPP